MAEYTRREYIKVIWARARQAWDGWEQLVALVLSVIAAVGYVGLWADWWDTSDRLAFVSTAIASLLLVGVFLWQIWLEAPAAVWRELKSQVDRLTDTSLSLSVQQLDATRSPRWNGWRASVLVTNTGSQPVTLRARAVPPIEGIGSNEYGPVTLHWDRGAAAEICLHPGEAEKLNVFKTENRSIMFIGPGEFKGPNNPDRYVLYEEHKAPADVRGTIEFRGEQSRCARAPFELTFDASDDNRPVLAPGEVSRC